MQPGLSSVQVVFADTQVRYRAVKHSVFRERLPQVSLSCWLKNALSPCLGSSHFLSFVLYHSIKITSANAEEPTAEGEEAPVAEEEEETAKPDSPEAKQSPETEQPCEAKQ